MNDEFKGELIGAVEHHNRLMQLWNEEQLDNYKVSINLFKEHCGKLGIEVNDDDFQFIPTIGVVANSPGLLLALVKEINIDKEGLYNCKDLYALFPKRNINPGYLNGEQYLLMLSPVFRREMNTEANWAPRFVDLFWQIDDPKIDSFISLDCDRVRVNVDNYSYFEADTWYGAPYNEDVSKIADGSVNLRPPTDIEKNTIDYLFKNAYALDIYWSSKGAIKTFQALEFKSEVIKNTLNNNQYHPVRYIHAEYDIEMGSFRHFDGAIQYYTSSEYYDRRDSNFRRNIKDDSKIKTISKKAFKFNGDISVEMWVEFCCHFVVGNPLIFEYFTGDYPNHTADALNKLRAKDIK